MQSESQRSNADIVRSMMEGFNKRDAALATEHIHPENFINHNAHAADGIEGVKSFVSHLPPSKTPSQIIRMLEDGPYIITHSLADVFGDKVVFDIFRLENGLLIEHWDNMAEVTPPNESGHTQADGPTAVADLEKTESNKAVVKAFYDAIFFDKNHQRMPEFFDGDAFIRHDSRGGDGLSALSKLMQQQAQQGTTMSVSKMHHLLGQGNFVLAAAEGAISGKPVAYYDLFRLQNGKIAEHWNTIEAIPPASESRNQNGKF